jgi:hypothetical protein
MSEHGRADVSVSRSELAARASAQAQRNKPKGVLVLGALVLLVGIVYLLVGRSALAGAERARSSEVATAANVLWQRARLEAHLDAQAGGDNRFDRVTNFTTLADSAAQSVGLSPVPTLRNQSQADPPGQEGIVERVYRYENVTSRNLEALIGWVAQVQSMVPGVEISRMELTPQRTQWRLSITFVKPEFSS